MKENNFAQSLCSNTQRPPSYLSLNSHQSNGEKAHSTMKAQEDTNLLGVALNVIPAFNNTPFQLPP